LGWLPWPLLIQGPWRGTPGELSRRSRKIGDSRARERLREALEDSAEAVQKGKGDGGLWSQPLPSLAIHPTVLGKDHRKATQEPGESGDIER
jgi:hypothetical protein